MKKEIEERFIAHADIRSNKMKIDVSLATETNIKLGGFPGWTRCCCI